MKLHKLSGQGLIEVLIALAIAVLFISAASVAILTGLNNAQHSKNQNLATEYAQQGIEFIKNIQVSNQTEYQNMQPYFGASASGVDFGYCLADTTTCPPFYNATHASPNTCYRDAAGSECDLIPNTIFQRKIVVRYSAAEKTKMGISPATDDAGFTCNSGADTSTARQVDAVVSWSDSKCKDPTNPYCNKVDLTACLPDLDNVPVP